MLFILYKNLKLEFETWMKKLNEPLNVLDLKPPTYKGITSILTKLSGSPCPHDQMSIIILKSCPILRTFIYKIISHCWKEWKFPSSLKYAFTILIHKKGSSIEPLNICPITLLTCFCENRFITYSKQN